MDGWWWYCVSDIVTLSRPVPPARVEIDPKSYIMSNGKAKVREEDLDDLDGQ